MNSPQYKKNSSGNKNYLTFFALPCSLNLSGREFNQFSILMSILYSRKDRCGH